MLSQIDFSEVSLEDFEFYEKLGSGSYGQVYRTKFKLNDEIYALKKLDKDFITKVFFSSSLKIESKNEKPSKGARYSDEY
jgi:serine/threonine protein kinase